MKQHLAPSTHRQALCTLLFLFTKVLELLIPWLVEVGRPRVRRRLPVVLSQEELAAVFRELDGVERLFAELLYGTGMAHSEGLQLRIEDIDFAHRSVIVRQGKGGKDQG